MICQDVTAFFRRTGHRIAGLFSARYRPPELSQREKDTLRNALSSLDRFTLAFESLADRKPILPPPDGRPIIFRLPYWAPTVDPDATDSRN